MTTAFCIHIAGIETPWSHNINLPWQNMFFLHRDLITRYLLSWKEYRYVGHQYVTLYVSNARFDVAGRGNTARKVCYAGPMIVQWRQVHISIKDRVSSLHSARDLCLGGGRELTQSLSFLSTRWSHLRGNSVREVWLRGNLLFRSTHGKLFLVFDVH